ncbi:MAG: hypothetical protein AVDCRST_MAG49-1595 [uncultured Thermomicrobiales bacterium]|uniref:Uncharacterized protein n=1 Tax=uncultured Thermomicrobiales bacterium TaxID=1645740 RepID=A0A6J4UFA7_9BACT|nr:MAG: hypothetical protein AVDCRST_MAG49-1595 [uncultured Thermomicrobiales bacterium]
MAALSYRLPPNPGDHLTDPKDRSSPRPPRTSPEIGGSEAKAAEADDRPAMRGSRQSPGSRLTRLDDRPPSGPGRLASRTDVGTPGQADRVSVGSAPSPALARPRPSCLGRWFPRRRLPGGVFAQSARGCVPACRGHRERGMTCALPVPPLHVPVTRGPVISGAGPTAERSPERVGRRGRRGHRRTRSAGRFRPTLR